jgi:AcrR family transcriptional regulator
MTGGDVHTRILEGTYRCVARKGIARTSLEDAAREAGVSRATVYRHFPGGRDDLIGAVIVHETLRFFASLAEEVKDAPDLTQLLVDGIVFAHRAIETHEVLQKVLETEPELVVPRLTLESRNLIALVRAFLEPRFSELDLAPGVSASQAADYVARMVLSFISAPGRWDLDDAAQVRELVASELLAGLGPGAGRAGPEPEGR